MLYVFSGKIHAQYIFKKYFYPNNETIEEETRIWKYIEIEEFIEYLITYTIMNKKITAIWIITSLLTVIALTSVSADYEDREYEGGKKWWDSEQRQEFKSKKGDKKKGKRWELHKWKWMNSEQKEEMKALFENLDEDIQNQLEELKSQHKGAIKALHESFEEFKWEEEKKEEFKAQMKALRDSNFEEIKSLLWEESEIVKKMEEHHAEKEAKKIARDEWKEKKKAFREARWDSISSYKTQFLEKIGDRIEKISEDKLKRILGKLDGLYTKTEWNTNLSDEQKETTLSKIVALQDLITEQLEETDLDIESLIN